MEDRLAPVLRALPYALRGTSTSELSFNTLGQLVLPVDLPPSLATALVPLAEPCVLFRTLDSTLQRVEPRTLVQQALFSGIRDKLRTYLALVSDIETGMLVARAPSGPTAPNGLQGSSDTPHANEPVLETSKGAELRSDPVPSVTASASKPSSAYTGLAALQALLQSPTLYLRLFLTLVRESFDIEQNVLNTLYTYAQHGDPLVSHHAADLQAQCYEPFSRLIRDWEDFGVLTRDVYGEFYIEHISQNELLDIKRTSRRDSADSARSSRASRREHDSEHESSEPPNHQLERNMAAFGRLPFRLLEKRVPRPMSLADAQRSLERGAAVHFIREVCGDAEFDGVNRTSEEIAERTRTLLFEDHELRLHFKGLRDYMLLANGNFVDALFRNDSTNFLMKPVSSVGSYLASEFFVSAVDDLRGMESASVTKCVDAYILGLEAKPVADHTSKERDVDAKWRVWEAFIGKYHLDSRPLRLIVDKHAVLAYERCFASLWRVRLAVYSLTEASSTLRWLSRNRNVAHLVDAHTIMNARMLEIQQFLYYGVVDHEWIKFENELRNYSSPTQIKSAHDTFLNRVTDFVASTPTAKAIQGLARTVLGLQRVLEDARLTTEVDADAEAAEESSVAALVASFTALADSFAF